MMLRHILLGVMILGLGGCADKAVNTVPVESIPEVTAVRAESPVVLDGKLDEAAWAKAPVYQFQRPGGYVRERARLLGANINETGSFRILYDDEFLYVGFELADGDLLALKDEDQQQHWQYGDVVEFFIKSPGAERYHELYATPLGRKTSWLIPGAGSWEIAHHFPQTLMPGFEVAVQARGTVNNQQDRDEGWCVEMKIPLAELQKDGVKFQKGIPGWTIQLVRTNHGNSLPAREPTCFPKQSSLYFHSPDRFAPLIIK